MTEAPLRQTRTAAIVPAEPGWNTTELLLDRAARTPQLPLFARRDGEQWLHVTAAQFLDDVRALAKGFIASGIEPGDRIGLLSRTRYEWTVIDFAAWFAGAIIVPIYETSSPFQIGWNLRDSRACALIVENGRQRARFESTDQDVSLIRSVWEIDGGAVTALAEAGTAISDEELERRRSGAGADDVATIIYTSGTTGNPKGCVLTHGNFVELTRNTVAALPEVFAEGGSTVLFLPLAHVFARFISVVAVSGGLIVAHQADTADLIATLGAFRPSFLLAVPRVFEKVYNASQQKAEASGRGRIFRAAAATAIARSRALDDGGVPLLLRLRFAVLDRLVLRRIREAIGGRVAYAVSGSAPLGERLGHFYRGIGISILEGYGLTETTAPTTVNRPSAPAIGTVGPPLPGMRVRIAGDGEIEIAGINVFREYWHNPEATAAAFDGEWFRTGDIGDIDADGCLRITGRKKELIITAGGKNVAPEVLEDLLRADTIIGQTVVVGDRRPFIAALITLDAEMLPLWLTNNGIAPELSLEDAAAHPVVVAAVQRAVDAANTHVSRAESIRKFRILPTEFTAASGHLTPKLSIRRHVVLADFAAAIDLLYTDAPTTGISVVH